MKGIAFTAQDVQHKGGRTGCIGADYKTHRVPLQAADSLNLETEHPRRTKGNLQPQVEWIMLESKLPKWARASGDAHHRCNRRSHGYLLWKSLIAPNWSPGFSYPIANIPSGTGLERSCFVFSFH
jgi:hypothetical protein